MSQSRDTLDKTLHRASARAWGIATGLVLGLGVLGATLWIVVSGGENPGAHLGRLSHIFPGYDVTVGGGLLGFFYAFVVGYALGRVLAPRAPISRAEREAELDKHVRLNARAWSLALGALFAVVLSLVTITLFLRGGERPGDMLEHLDIFFPGYAISWSGAFVGGAWAFAVGWISGQVLAFVYNRAVVGAEQKVARA
jgi:hypothetical protein